MSSGESAAASFLQKKITPWSPLNKPQLSPDIPELDWDSPIGEQIRKVANHAALECSCFSRNRRGSHEMIINAIEMTKSQKKQK